MEYYDMCGAAYDVSFLSIDTNARNCRCLCGLRIITKAYSQASSARSIAQPPLGMTPWSFEYWRLALDFGKNVHIGWYMCKYGGTCAKNGKIVQNQVQIWWYRVVPLSLFHIDFCTKIRGFWLQGGTVVPNFTSPSEGWCHSVGVMTLDGFLGWCHSVGIMTLDGFRWSIAQRQDHRRVSQDGGSTSCAMEGMMTGCSRHVRVTCTSEPEGWRWPGVGC